MGFRESIVIPDSNVGKIVTFDSSFGSENLKGHRFAFAGYLWGERWRRQ